jgi:hypothetical protein
MKNITALISSMNRSEYLENTIEKCLKINHCFTYRDIGLVEYIICKFIFLKTFFKIYFRHEKIIYFSVLKRALPIILLPASLNLLKDLFGFNIVPMSIQLKSK